MKRPMCVIGAAFALATWAAFFFSAGQAMLLSAAALATGLLAAALPRLFVIPRPGRLRAVCAACLVAALAFAAHALREVRQIEPFLRAEGETVRAEGLITGMRRGSRTIYYTFAAAFPERADLPAATLTLRAYGDLEYLPGDALRCEVLLAPRTQPRIGPRLPTEKALEGVLRGAPERVEGGYALRRGLLRLRERLRGNVYNHLRRASADVVAAMVLGMEDNVSAETWSALNRAGTVHLLAVSGLHLSILTAALLRLLARLRLPRRAQQLLAIAATFAFAVLVGFSASIIRSAVMTAITLAAGLGKRRGDSLSALGLAVTVICVAWPQWVLGKGFWLSAGSTLGILLFAEPLTGWLYARLGGGGKLYNRLVKTLVGAGAVSVAAYAVTLPFLIGFSGWASLVSPLANILVAPFVPGVILGGIVTAVIGPSAWPVRAAAWLTDLCTALVLRISQVMANLPFATVPFDEGWMLPWLLLAALTTAVVLAFRTSCGKRLAACGAAMLALAWSLGGLTQSLADRQTVELATIAECEAAVLLRGGDAVILGTPAYYEANRLLRYLEFRGVGHIRAVVAADCGEQIGSGLLRLAERYPVDCVIGPDDAYILGQLAAALPEIPVYSGGYAAVTALGGARITLTVPRGEILVTARNNMVLKSASEYAIIKDNVFSPYSIGLFAGGAVVQQGAAGWEPTPIGTALYGERRWRLVV